MNAIIYCRVSSREQVEGTSLESQESACREYARRHGMVISRIFVEEGESAKFADRAQLLEAISYCKNQGRSIEVLLVWKVDRFARNVEDHFAIKATLRKLGVRVLSVTEPIEADPNGKLLETILAGFAQFDNDIRALRTIQGMQQRLRDGIFPWKPPLGYLPPKIGKKTTPDQPDPQCFEPLRKAWELYATGVYTKMAILRLLRAWGIHGYRGELINVHLLDHMFRNTYYAGILKDPWTGAEYEGKHVAMVSPQDFMEVQRIINGRNRTMPHQRIHEAFPIRSFVRCPSCQQTMTGAVSRGQTKRYPYYHCFRSNCPTRRKSYPAKVVHDEFLGFLRDSSLPTHLITPILEAVDAGLVEHARQAQRGAARRHAKIASLDHRLQELISMRTSRLISDGEFTEQRASLMRQRQELGAAQVSKGDLPLTKLEAAMIANSLSDLNALWDATPPDMKREFALRALPSGYVFQTVRTASNGLLFKTIRMSATNASHVVPFVRKNTNELLADIRHFLAIINHEPKTYKEVA